jgi:hypothetical protein
MALMPQFTNLHRRDRVRVRVRVGVRDRVRV